MTGSLPSICRPGNEPADGPQSEEAQRLRVSGERGDGRDAVAVGNWEKTSTRKLAAELKVRLAD